MATWVDPVDSQTDPDAPITSDLAKRWDNNVVALAEGAAGAPRIADAAMGPTATNNGRDWVNNRVALSQVGAVGTYAMLALPTGSWAVSNPGFTISGNNLRYAGGNSSLGPTPSGNWMLMGYIDAGGGSSLWLCVS